MTLDNWISLSMLVAMTATAWFTWGLLRNDNRRFKRRPIIVEPVIEDSTADADGWRWWSARIRNPETAAARITGARATHWHHRVFARHKMSWSEALSIDDGFGNVGRPDFDNAKSTTTVYGYVQPGSETTVRIAIYGIDHARDVTLIWQWADH